MVCLRIVVVIQCLGVGGRYLFSSFETESDIYGWLYFDRGWPESLAQSIDNAGILLTLASGIVVGLIGLFQKQFSSDSRTSVWLNRLDQASCTWLTVWMFLIATAHLMRASSYAEIAWAEHAVRYAAPLVLLLGTRKTTASNSVGQRSLSSVAFEVLVIAAAATFMAHGYKAVECYGPFLDLILLTDAAWTNWNARQSFAEKLLFSIGIVDLIVAFWLILTHSRFAVIYMVVWGFVTAASRVTAFGIDAWPETLMRVANGGLPLAIAIDLASRSPKTRLAITETPSSSEINEPTTTTKAT